MADFKFKIGDKLRVKGTKEWYDVKKRVENDDGVLYSLQHKDCLVDYFECQLERHVDSEDYYKSLWNNLKLKEKEFVLIRWDSTKLETSTLIGLMNAMESDNVMFPRHFINSGEHKNEQ